MKETFINKEIWMLSLMGAFQRAKVYKPNSPELEKIYFKNMLKGYVDNLIKTQYHKVVSENSHLENIAHLIKFSGKYSNILSGGKINFGIAQKLLNLYLKYNWCMEKIAVPPHFPVDSIIQKKLGLPVVPWTRFLGKQGVEQYLNIINHAKTKLGEQGCQNIAELELKLFNRNNQ